MRVQKGESIATIHDPLADAVRLNAQRMERAFGEAEIARIED
ncbi:hypothetical protein [Ponticoccus alexandrii]|nr:hypothetical protein [Ponticoccus alexandrii]